MLMLARDSSSRTFLELVSTPERVAHRLASSHEPDMSPRPRRRAGLAIFDSSFSVFNGLKKSACHLKKCTCCDFIELKKKKNNVLSKFYESFLFRNFLNRFYIDFLNILILRSVKNGDYRISNLEFLFIIIKYYQSNNINFFQN